MKSWLNILALFFCLFLFSCRTVRQPQLLDGVIDTVALGVAKFPEPIIQKGDLIGITVYSDNPEATSIFNQQMATSLPQTSIGGTAAISSTIGANTQSMPGYLVDADGNIQFQRLGILHIEGLNKRQLGELLKSKLSVYLKNPYCNIRFLNYKVTILGEVNRQGVYTVSTERVNLLEAIGMAGDLTTYSLKDSILVIRETNGKRTFSYLDISKPEALLSPYYDLQQNDVVIVRSNPKKPSLTDESRTRTLTLIATAATIVTSVAVLLNIILR